MWIQVMPMDKQHILFSCITIQTVPPPPLKKMFDETVEINEFLHWKKEKKQTLQPIQKDVGGQGTRVQVAEPH